MDLNLIKTLQDVSKEFNIPDRTLNDRLTSKAIGMVDGVDYKKLGYRMPTILSPEGIKKIIKNEQ